MKKIIIMSIFNLLLFSSISFAQNSSSEKATKMTDKMKNELNLTGEQYELALEINKTYLAKFEELRTKKEENATPGLREEFMKADQNWNTELEKVLSEEQFKNYQKNKENQKGSRNSSGRRNR